MSKSLRRVETALTTSGAAYDLRELTDSTRTAQEAAAALGVAIDQIAKSIIVEGQQSGGLALFVTAGGHRVDMARVADLLSEPAHPAPGTTVRAVTGFAIGGVSPVGHKTPIPAFFDPRLLAFDTVWAAAGTPRHIVGLAPAILRDLSGAKTEDFVQQT